MHATSFNLPEEIVRALDSIVASGAARNRTEIIVRAVQNFVRLRMVEWNEPIIVRYGSRTALLTQGSLQRLVDGMPVDQLYNAGKRMGKTLRDSALIGFGADISRPKDHKIAFQILEECGWGKFSTKDNAIMLTKPFMPPEMMRGYLESALSLRLVGEQVSEDVDVFTKLVGQEGEVVSTE